MKHKDRFKIHFTTHAFISILFISLLMILDIKIHSQDTFDYNLKLSDIAASARAMDLGVFDKVANDFHMERQRLGSELLQNLKDPDSSNLRKCASAYYLGELGITEAVDTLSTQIKLDLDMSHIQVDGLPRLPGHPAMEALIEIGAVSIPAVIRNLAESDDAQCRELSLTVLCRIEGDKDVVQLRLEKALKLETNSQKQLRLQSALKSLGGIEVRK
jgi:hypothetical protein